MESILKVRELLPGKYTIESYEPAKSSFGATHIITATHESNETLKFWSNAFLCGYINTKKPTRKFNIEIVEGKIIIPGYSRIIKLY